MTNLMQKSESAQIERLTSKKRIPAFRPGDTVKVTLKMLRGSARVFRYMKVYVLREKIIQ